MTMTAPPKRVRRFEPIGPVADRLGVSVDALRDLAKVTGEFTRNNPVRPRSPMLFTAEHERAIERHLVEAGGSRSAPQDSVKDLF